MLQVCIKYFMCDLEPWRWTRHDFQTAGRTRREWPEVDATYRRHHVEGSIATALPQVAETSRRREWWPAVLLRHGDSVSTGVRLFCVALQSLRRTDEGAGVATAQSDAGHFPGQRLHDVAHQSRTRNAGVATRPADRTIFPAQCPAGVIMPSLSASGQARSLCHGKTLTSKKLWNFKT